MAKRDHIFAADKTGQVYLSLRNRKCVKEMNELVIKMLVHLKLRPCLPLDRLFQLSLGKTVTHGEDFESAGCFFAIFLPKHRRFCDDVRGGRLIGIASVTSFVQHLD